MGWIPTIELPARPVAHRDQGRQAPGDARRLVRLGEWMVFLGALRLIGAVVAAVRAYLEVLTGPVTPRGWGDFLPESSPIFILIYAWPLVVGLAVRQTRWAELVKAGALTFLILSIGGVLTAAADWGRPVGRSIAVGSFRVPAQAPGPPGAAEAAAALAGTTQLLLEFAVALRAILLSFRTTAPAEADAGRYIAATRTRFARLALFVSAAFLILTMRLPAFPVYMKILDRWPFLREWLLRDDFRRLRSMPGLAAAIRSPWTRDAQSLLGEALEAGSREDYAAAAAAHVRLAGMLGAIPTSSMTVADRGLAARAFNNYAWLLATCPDPKLRNGPDSVEYARRAVELQPKEANYWNTLGVALFRTGEWEESREALYRSMELHDEGDSFDWFFLAMIHSRLNHKDRGREWYEKAAQWSRLYGRGNPELYRFQLEAAAELGLPTPEPMAPPPPPSHSRMARSPVYPFQMRYPRGRGQPPPGAVGKMGGQPPPGAVGKMGGAER